MKDGHWLVPAEQRPRGWESMGVAEMEPEPKHRKQRTVTATKSEHTVERHVTESLSVTEDIRETEPAPIVTESQAVLENPKPALMSHVPDDPPDYRNLADTALKLYGVSVGDGEWDASIFEEMEALGDRVHAYREAKTLTDTLLTEWTNRHAAQLRHIGLGSKPIQDLWNIVQQLMWEKRLLEREGATICQSLDNKADAWYDRMRKLVGLEPLENSQREVENGADKKAGSQG